MLRSSGARTRDWFCMRGRSVEERAMFVLGPAGIIGGDHSEDIMTFINRRKRRATERPQYDNGPA